ncbi:hypothetical protein EAE96_007754 [Botrytis aclada]|nr:hypothetical protein EAE96_007754 [Botrytis aclada]
MNSFSFGERCESPLCVCDEERLKVLPNIDDVKREAQKKYPHESSEKALATYVIENYIRGVEFQRNGRRFICGPDKKIYYDKLQRRGELVTFWWNSEYRKTPQLNEVDRTSNVLLRRRQFLRQDPGDSWNHPPSHPHHILKFPKEIINKILSFILVVEEEEGSLVPDTITCNISSPYLYREPHYNVHCSEYIGPICQSNPWFHSQWSYQYRIKLRIIHKYETSNPKMLRVLHKFHDSYIDASCLRVCKDFYSLCSALLYRDNSFTFTAFKSSALCRGVESVCMVDDNKPRKRNDNAQFGKPNSSLLSLSDWNHEIDRGISQIQNPSTVDRMNWLYYDPFLRFLHTIGLKNAALMKTLQFTGAARGTANPLLRRGIARPPLDDIRLNLQIYVKFINQFCPGVQQITLNIHPGDGRDGTPEEEVSLLLGDHIRELKSVNTLILRTVDISEPEKHVPMKFPLAIETMQWFANRSKERAVEERRIAGFMVQGFMS